jgi:hypothetical protein
MPDVPFGLLSWGTLAYYRFILDQDTSGVMENVIHYSYFKTPWWERGRGEGWQAVTFPLRIYPNRENTIVIARRSETTKEQSPHARGDYFARKRLARNDDQVWLRLEAALS